MKQLVSIAAIICGIATIAHPEPPTDPAPPHVAPQAPTPSGAQFTARERLAKAVIAAALASRTMPDLVRSKRPTTAQKRCAIEVGSRPASDAELSRKELESRNGSRWQIQPQGLNEFNGAIRSAILVNAGDPTPNKTSLAADDAVRLAASFIATNYDLFDLDRDDLEASNVSFGKGLNDEYQFLLLGSRPEPGFDAFPSMQRKWTLGVTIGSSGVVSAAFGHNDTVAGVSICTTPKLHPTDSQLLANVIGYKPTYSTRRGRVERSSPLAKDDIQSIVLTIHRRPDRAPERMTLRLAYAVTADSGRVKLFVDADTAELIAVEQLFIQ